MFEYFVGMYEFVVNIENEIKQYRRISCKMIITLMLGKFQMLTSKRINFMGNKVGH